MALNRWGLPNLYQPPPFNVTQLHWLEFHMRDVRRPASGPKPNARPLMEALAREFCRVFAADLVGHPNTWIRVSSCFVSVEVGLTISKRVVRYYRRACRSGRDSIRSPLFLKRARARYGLLERFL